MRIEGWIVGGFLGAGLLGAGAVGCARGPSYLVEPENEQAVAAAHTVSLAGGDPAVILSEDYGEARWAEFPEQVLTLLKTRGFVAATPDRADLWLRAHLLFKRQGGRGEGGAGHRGGGEGGGGRHAHGGGDAPSGGHRGETRPSKDVKVVLELMDRATQQPVWTGSVAATLQEPPFTAEGRRELNGLMAQLVARLRGPAGSR